MPPNDDQCTPERGANPCSVQINQTTQQTQQGVNENALKLDAILAALAAIQALLQALDFAVILARLNLIISKLDEFRSRFEQFSKWMRLDRVLNLLTLAATLHNAYMLSNMLSQTLFSMLSNVLSVIGIEDDEGNPYDVGSILGGGVHSIASAILGVETVDGIEEGWKKFSRIYQAAANLMFSIQSIGWSILGALEVVGSYVSWIGNALKKWGVLMEKCYPWMNPNPDFQNRYLTALQDANEVVEAIDQVAGEVLSIQETLGRLGNQQDELLEAVESGIGIEVPENTPTLDQEESSKDLSQSPLIAPSDENRPED